MTGTEIFSIIGIFILSGLIIYTGLRLMNPKSSH